MTPVLACHDQCRYDTFQYHCSTAVCYGDTPLVLTYYSTKTWCHDYPASHGGSEVARDSLVKLGDIMGSYRN